MALIEIKPDKHVEVPDAVVLMLKRFEDMIPPKLPKKLRLRRQTDHQIELVLGSRPPVTPPELIELRMQLTELLDAGLV